MIETMPKEEQEYQLREFTAEETEKSRVELDEWFAFYEEYAAGIPRALYKHEIAEAKREFKKQREIQKQSNMSTLNTPTVSTVKSVTGAGNFTNEHGTFNSWEYAMEDGTTLKANHKDTTQPFEAGATIEYVITRQHPQHGNSGKVGLPQDRPASSPQASRPQPSNQFKQDPDKAKSIEMQVCLKEANSFHAQHGFDTDAKQKEITQTAQIFYDELFA